MPEYLSPGVYVEETEGSKSVGGVSTSTAGFLGETERGPLKPQLVTGFNDYKRKYGGYVEDSFLTHAIDGFFKNGGSRAFIGRITDVDRHQSASTTLADESGEDVISVSAVGPGDWGSRIAVTVSDAPMSSENNTVFSLSVRYWSDVDSDDVENPGGEEPDPMPSTEERFDEINAKEGSTQYYESALEGSSNLIVVEKHGAGRPENQTVWLDVASTDGGVNGDNNGSSGDDGDDGDDAPDIPSADELDDMLKDELVDVAEELGLDADQTKDELIEAINNAREEQLVADGGAGLTVGDYEGDGTPGQRTGLAAFEEISNISIVCAPGENDVPGLTQSLVAHCENMKERIAILQAPQNPDPVADHETPVDSTYAAYYYPWINVMHPKKGVQVTIPPGGHVAGIFARNDNEGGVHEAPANMIVRGAMSLQVDLTKAEQDVLNPKGVNCIRSFQGRGIRVWGARTTSSDPEWKYVNVRRLFLFLKQSIDEGTQWAVFEPNDQDLWARVVQTIEGFLRTQWREGALMGPSESEAFYVDCGKGSTMTQDDIDNGRLICEIGVAPVKPAEFVIFRIGQWTGDS